MNSVPYVIMTYSNQELQRKIDFADAKWFLLGSLFMIIKDIAFVFGVSCFERKPNCVF